MANSGIEVEIYKDSAPFDKIGVIEARQRPTALREIEGHGAGSFQVPKANAKVLAEPDLLEYRNFVRIRTNGKCTGGFLLTNKNHAIVGEGEATEEVWAVSGEGLRSWGKDAKVRPSKGISASSRETRFFNFSTEQGAWYNASQWVNATTNWYVRNWAPGGTNPWQLAPADWPDAPQAYWIWDRWGPITSIPLGTVYFRKEFNLTEAGQYALFFAVDDQAEVYIDGELIHTTADHAWQETTRQDMDLEAGSHVLAFKASNNWPGTPGSLVAAFYKIGNAASPTAAQRLFVSDSSWKVCGYPTTEPGWTPGNILITLLNEAKARGIRFANNWTTTFSNTHDSAGNPWPTLSINFDVGTGYDEVFEALEETACDIYLDPDDLKLYAWIKRGEDRSIEGAAGGTFVETRRNMVPVPQPTAYAGSGWAAAGGTVTTPGWITATVNSPTTGYFFTDGAEEAIQIGDVVTFSVTYRVDALGTGSLATHVRSVPHIRTGNTYIAPSLAEMQAQDILRPIVVGKTERVSYTWTADRAIAAGDLDFAVTTAADQGSFASVTGGFAWAATRIVIERGGTDGSFFDGSNPTTAERQYVWLGPVNNSISLERSLTNVNPVILRVGHNLITADEKGQADIVNTLLLKTADGWQVVQPTDTTSVTKYGVLEGQLSTDMAAAAAAPLVGEVFKQKALPEKTATYELVPVPGMVPWENFFEGDYVSATGETGALEKRRVMSISVSENEVGDPVYAVEFDAIFKERADELEKMFSKATGTSSLGSGFTGATGTPSTATQGNNTSLPVGSPPQAPAGVTVTSTGRWADSGAPVSDYGITWTPVIFNMDDMPVTDIESYEVWGRRSTETDYNRLTTVLGTTAYLPGYRPGEDWYFQIRAQSRTGGYGFFSEEKHLIGVAPIQPLPKPSTPTLVSDMGVVSITWNGLLNGAAPATRFKHMEVQRSTTQAGTYIAVGTLISNSTSDTTGTVGTTYWYRFVPVDYLGVKGTASDPASILVKGVLPTDLDESIQEAIDAAQAAADAAAATAGAASTAAGNAQAAAEAAQTSATNAVNSVDRMLTWSSAAPVLADGTGKPIDAIWYRTSGTGVIGQWRWNGTAWVSSPIDSDAILSVNAAKLTAGILDAARIGAGSISTSKLLVSNLDNQAENASFEYGTAGWTLGTGAVIGATNPRTGASALACTTTTSARVMATQVAAIAVEEGEQYRVSGWVRLASGAVANTGVALRMAYGPTEASTTLASADLAITEDTTTTTYVRQTGEWTVPAGAKFARLVVLTRDITAGKVYYVDDVSVYAMAAGELIVDGAITAVKIGADEINADHMQAGSIATEALQAGAVITEKLAADSVTANELKAGSVFAEHLTAGAVQTNHLSPAVGNDLDISANSSVNIIIGRQDDLESDLDATNGTVEELSTYYSFGPDGAIIGQSDSAFKLILKNDRVEIVENGVVVSYWDSGRMVVPSFVGNEVVLGNHKLEKYGSGTVVRAI